MPVQEICRQIKKLAEEDARPSQELYADIMKTGAQMYFSRQWPRDGVIGFCAMLVRFLENQTPKKD